MKTQVSGPKDPYGSVHHCQRVKTIRPLKERMLRQIGALQPYDPVIDPAVAHFFHQGPGVVARHGLQADLNVFGKVERAPGHPN